MEEKYKALTEQLKSYGHVAVAFSGGVDSTFLLAAAKDALGERVLAITACPCSFTKREKEETQSFCQEHQIVQVFCPVSEVHFHEVGAMDAIADVSAVCYLMDCLKPEKVTASEIHVGNGTVKCAHGILPVPAPATANIVRNLPWAHGKIDGEICTPTGAALIRYFADQFADAPEEGVTRTGTGIGRRTFTRPSYFQVSICEA